mgnify:CR=1 FL=1
MDIKQIEHYLKQTSFTNPFEYSFMYEGIPDDIGDICNLVNQQLIHPTKLYKYPEVTSLDLKKIRFAAERGIPFSNPSIGIF